MKIKHFFYFTIWKINISQFEKLLNILSIQIISKKMKKCDNKTIEKLIFRYFNIRNFEISKFQSFCISSFKILTPTPSLLMFFYVYRIITPLVSFVTLIIVFYRVLMTENKLYSQDFGVKSWIFIYNWYIDSVCEDKALHQV